MTARRQKIDTPTDAVVKIIKTTICSTDLHILKGDVPTYEPGRILGHEGIGMIVEIGAIEAVGIPSTFVLCEDIVAPGGVIANVGMHGAKADLHLERLRSHNISITTRLVVTVTTPMLLKTVAVRKLDPKQLITHHFKRADLSQAYDTFWAGSGYVGVERHHRSLID